jgi:hypothetical protein
MMPAGKYLIGDLCYVMHPQWDEVCKLLFAGRTDHGCNEGEFVLANGVRFAIYNTAYGDGTYPDNLGNAYPVDAGSIGCIRVEDVNDTTAWLDGMTVHTFNEPFETSTDGAVLTFGHVTVDTDPELDEDTWDEYDCNDDLLED